ncbi:MAG: IS3 family transposase [Bacteroidota bacterium]
MKKSRFTESQVVKILNQHEAGMKVSDLCKEHGISQGTFYNWKNKYGGMDASMIKRLKELEEENRKLKQMYADLSLENHAMKDLIEKKPLSPDQKRSSVDYLRSEHGLSLRKSCKILKLSSSVYYYQPKERDDGALIESLSALSDNHPKYGFKKLFHMLRNQGFEWNHKRVYRVYCQLGLNQRRKRKRRIPDRVKQTLVWPIGPNITWSMDFMHDSLSYGKSFRTLNILDDFNREVLNIVIDTSIGSKRVVRELNQLIEWRGKPKQIRVDNGPEFLAFVLDKWCQKHGIDLLFIRPGKPTENSYVERFNRTYREEVLSAWLIESLSQARALTQEWIWHYNHQRPHESLGNMTPRAFVLKYGKVSDFPTFQHDLRREINLEFLPLTVAN